MKTIGAVETKLSIDYSLNWILVLTLVTQQYDMHT